MALLQISEPDEPAPRERRLAVGIDLGTTNSLVATVRNSIAVVLNDEDGHPLLPSIPERWGHGLSHSNSRRPKRHSSWFSHFDSHGPICRLPKGKAAVKSRLDESEPVGFRPAAGGLAT